MGSIFRSVDEKRESNVTRPRGELWRVARPVLITTKTLLLLVFTCNKKFYVDDTDKGETVDSSFYVDFVLSAGDSWTALRTDPTKLCELWWQHDNARPHTAKTTSDFFDLRGIHRVWQSPYSPNFNLCVRFVFSYLKKELRKSNFDTAAEVKSESLRIL